MHSPNHYGVMFMPPHPPIEIDEDGIVRKGNPEEDAYAFLRTIISECVTEGRFRGELKDVDLLAQVVWSGVHGVISLQIAKCNDGWIDWKPLKKRAALAIDVLIEGLTKQRRARRSSCRHPKRQGRKTMVDLATKSLLHDKLRFFITVCDRRFA